MAQVIGWLGGGGMIAFVLLLAVRCLALRGWLPVPLPDWQVFRREEPLQGPAWFSRRDYAAAFCAVLTVQWAVLFFAWLTLNQSGGFGAFLTHFWQRFTQAGDSPHYLFIAQNGYVPSGEDAKWIVFYPLYPLCIRLMSLFTGGNFELAGILVSQLCWGGCGAVALSLAGRWLPRSRAVWAVGFLAVYPFAFFSMGVYTESLFLLLCLGCMRLALTGRWGWAGLLGGLAALCRTQGMVLLLPVLWLWLRARKNGRQGPKSLGLLLIPAGWGGYLDCNRLLFGDWFAFLEFQAAPPWYQTTKWIGENLTQHWNLALQYPGLASFIYWPQVVLYFAVLALLFWGLFTGARTEWLIWGGAYLGITSLAGWMISGPRYLLSCLSVFFLLARIRPIWLRAALGGLSAMALFAYGALYMQGQAIM